MSPQKSDDPLKALCQDFRHHLQQFYGRLSLAPPYHSVEKAVQHLTAILKKENSAEQTDMMENLDHKWAIYCQAFKESGLDQKHRGIIRGLIQAGQCTSFPKEFRYLLNSFLSTHS